ncbi:MAG: MSHA-type pilus biogenesis protein MshL [Parcubacteria group bacterium GW2011_GWA2_43_17]|nr:MAG: MSHA-type pilus biogenesis protein MshL [Parcubacteria group bacterium GW2011_GWA2_43_17]KKT90725.1 MAG: MSHA-type pilus biogenesis protein MshL [Parcubacteria group bacterium GW2011_GWF2_45_11]
MPVGVVGSERWGKGKMRIRQKNKSKKLLFFSFLVAQASLPVGTVGRDEAFAQAAVKNEEKISLDLKGVEIAELFKILSAKSGYTIIATPGVKGRVTVFLNNLSFDDVLDVVLNLQDLACERNGNVVKVMTSAEYEEAFGAKYGERKKVKTIKLSYAKPSNIASVISSLKSEVGKIIVDEPSGTLLLIDSPPALAVMESAIKELDAPLETAVFDINYANANDIKAYLNDLITPGVGQLIIDSRSDKAVVSDLPERLAKIKKLMREFDEASRQVLITGEIIQVALNDKFQRGIEWEQLLSQRKWDDLDLVGKFPLSSSLSSYGKLSIGTLSRDDYNVIVKLLQEYGDTRILSRPRIVAVNKQEAKILVGSREAYVTQTQSQASSTTVTSESVSFIDVGVKLGVVPTISKDGFITMKIKPEVSSVRETLTTSAGSQIPIVETSETETVVKVKDGSMVMIGGLLKEEKRDDSSGLPAISRLPWIGSLFGTRARQNKKTELVIFLSARLISGENQLELK